MIFGRDNELAALHAAYSDMLAGHGSVLFLTGEAGLGKTTLVHTWAQERNTHPATLFLESACSIPIGNVDVGRLEALQPWADVVAQLQEKLAAPVAQERKLDVRKLMRDAAPAWLWALPFVGEVAHAALVTARLVQDQRTGTESRINSPTGPDPATDNRQFVAANQEQVFQQYVNLLTKISEETPLVIFLDDLHWADTSSCNLLFYLSRQIAGKRILVIATYRQDDAVRAEDGKGHAIITVKNEILRYSTGKEFALTYLNREAIRDFLTNTFAAQTDDVSPVRSEGKSAGYITDDKFESWLQKISDGNSLFMTQFVRTLREDRHLDDRGKFVGDYASVVIPTSALAVVEERTRRLDGDTRELLMYATAEGEEFTTYVLEHLSDMKPMELHKKLHTATTMGLITQRGTGRLFANTTTGIFGFSHALFHKALYNSLLDVQKQYLHKQCFQLLKSEWDRLEGSKQRTTTLATKLLAHASKCEEWETVTEVALAAAQEFWKSYNEVEALEMISRILEATDAAEGLRMLEGAEGDLTTQGADSLLLMRAEAFYLKGEIDFLRGRHDESVSAYRAAEVLFLTSGTATRAVDAVNGLTRSLLATRSFGTSHTEAIRALQDSRYLGHRLGEAAALNNIGHVHREQGAFEQALRHYEQSLEIFAAVGNGMGEAGALNNIGLVKADQGALDQALEYYARALARFTIIGNRRGEGSVLHNIGSAHHDLGAYDEALSYTKRSLALFESCVICRHRQPAVRGELVEWHWEHAS